HDVRAEDIIGRRLHATLAAAADRGPSDFPDLLLTPGVGARTVQALAMVAEVVHGAPCRFADPARFSLAHGGKDRHPYPVPIRVYGDKLVDPKAKPWDDDRVWDERRNRLPNHRRNAPLQRQLPVRREAAQEIEEADRGAGIFLHVLAERGPELLFLGAGSRRE